MKFGHRMLAGALVALTGLIGGCGCAPAAPPKKPVCSGAALRKAMPPTSSPTVGITDVRCAGGWATARRIVRYPNGVQPMDALAVFRAQGSGWRIVKEVGGDGVCDGLGVPASVRRQIAC